VTRGGRGTGLVIGGCLSLLVSLLGTPWDVPYDECILFWEDIGEAPYRIDRMLTQLRNAGKLDRLRGMLIGSTTDCAPAPGRPSLSLQQVVEEVTAGSRYPIVWNVKAGHLKHRIVLPLGARATIDTAKRTLTYQVKGRR
jgi:muramoyltetrapeptide carboxypeptidase